MGLVDECHFFLCPVVVGGGLPALPDGVRVGLELLDEDRFGNGTVHLHYRVKSVMRSPHGAIGSSEQHGSAVPAAQGPADDGGQNDHHRDHRSIAYRIRVGGYCYC